MKGKIQMPPKWFQAMQNDPDVRKELRQYKRKDDMFYWIRRAVFPMWHELFADWVMKMVGRAHRDGCS